MAARKRTELSIKEKVELLKNSDGKSSRQLAEKYGVGRTQVQNLMKRKREILDSYEDDANSSRKRQCVSTVNNDLNDLMWQWFQKLRSQMIPVSGPMMQEKALAISQQLNLSDFKASTGWLRSFKQRHNINGARICGESGSVDVGVVTDWQEKLPSITEGYAPRDIYNMDESGVFYRQLPDRTLRIRGEDCKGGKKSKERLTAVLCCNMVGDFEKTMVIGNAEKPRCFKNITISALPVTWKSNKKSWMNSYLYREWLQKFDERMIRQKRKVILFVDNAPGHPKDAKTKNVKVVFLPSNTTSQLQPLDQGIIQTFKQHYRKRLLRAIIANAEKDPTNTGKVNVLDASQWIAAAVKDVKPSTVTACFRRCGFTVPECDEDSDDDIPLSDLMGDIPLSQLITAASQRLNITDPMTVEEFTNADTDAPASEQLTDNWEQQLVDDFVTGTRDAECDEDTQEDTHVAEPEFLINNVAEALKWAAQLKMFTLNKGLDVAYEHSVNVESELQCVLSSSKLINKQTSIKSFFSKS